MGASKLEQVNYDELSKFICSLVVKSKITDFSRMKDDLMDITTK